MIENKITLSRSKLKILKALQNGPVSRKDLLSASHISLLALRDKALITIEKDDLRLGANKRLEITDRGLSELSKAENAEGEISPIPVDDGQPMLPTMTADEFAWLTGLLEGEGCFCYDLSPGIKVGMTDKDVIVRVARLLGNKKVKGPCKNSGSTPEALYKDVYYTEVWSGPAIDIMKAVLPHMGDRRSSKIREIISEWERAPSKGHKFGGGKAATCHPDRRHYANNLCRSCWRKDRWKKGLAR
jgi:hypothetical protein